jgi:hypothetical protein
VHQAGARFRPMIGLWMNNIQILEALDKNLTANQLEQAVQRIHGREGWAAGVLAANCAEGTIVGSRNNSPSKSQK